MYSKSMPEGQQPMEFVPGKQRFLSVDPVSLASEFHDLPIEAPMGPEIPTQYVKMQDILKTFPNVLYLVLNDRRVRVHRSLACSGVSHSGDWIHAHPRSMIQVIEQDIAQVRKMEETVCLCPSEQENLPTALKSDGTNSRTKAEVGMEGAGAFKRSSIPTFAHSSPQISQHAVAGSGVVTTEKFKGSSVAPTLVHSPMAIRPLRPLRHVANNHRLSLDSNSNHTMHPQHHLPLHRRQSYPNPDVNLGGYNSGLGHTSVQRSFIGFCPGPSLNPTPGPPTPRLIPRPAPFLPMQAPPPSARHWPMGAAEMPASFWIQFRQELNADRVQLRQEIMEERDRYRQQMEAQMNQVHLTVNTNHERVLQAMDGHVQQICKDIGTSTEDLTRKINAVEVMPDWFENWLTVWYDYQTDFVKGQRRFNFRQRKLGLPTTTNTTATITTTIHDKDNEKQELIANEADDDDNKAEDGDSDYEDVNNKNHKGKIRLPSRIIVRPPTGPTALQSKRSVPKVAEAPKAPKKKAPIKKSKTSSVAASTVRTTQATSSDQGSASQSDAEDSEWIPSAETTTSESVRSTSGKSSPAVRSTRTRALPLQPKRDATLLTKKRGFETVQDDAMGERSLKRCKTESTQDENSPRPGLPEILIIDSDDVDNEDEDEEEEEKAEEEEDEVDFGDVEDEEDQEPEEDREPEGNLEPEGNQDLKDDQEPKGDQEPEDNQEATTHNDKAINTPTRSRKRPRLPSDSSSSPAPRTSSSSSSTSLSTSTASSSPSSSSPGPSKTLPFKSCSDDEGPPRKKRHLDTSPQSLVKFVKKHGKSNGHRDRDVDIYLHTRDNAHEFYALIDANPRAVNLLDLQIKWDFNHSDMEEFAQCLERSFIRELIIYQPANETVDDGEFAARLLQNKKLTHLMLRHFTDFLQQPELTLPMDLSHLKDIEFTFKTDSLSSPHMNRTREFFRRLSRLERVILRSPPELCQAQLTVLKRILTSIAAEATKSLSSSSSSPRLPSPNLMILFRCCRNIAFRVEVVRATAEFRSIELLHRSLNKAEIQWASLLAIPCCRSIPIIDIQSTVDDTWVQILLQVTASRRTCKTEAPLRELLLNCTHVQSASRVKDLASILHEFRDSLTAVGLTDFRPMAHMSDEPPMDPRLLAPPAAKGTGATRCVMVSGWKAIFSALDWLNLEWLDLSFSNIGHGEINIIIGYLRQIADKGPNRIRKLIIVTDSLSTNRDFQRLTRTVRDNHWGEFVAIKEKK